MKRQSEAEWLARTLHNNAETWRVSGSLMQRKSWDDAFDCERSINTFIARRLLAALKRRGWKKPKGMGKK